MANSIVITGAGGGIGRRTALTFLEAGWNVALVGRRADALEDTASTAAEAGSVGEALALPGDVTDASAVEDIFAAAAVKFGRIDALFNNAGRGSPFATIDETPVEDFLAVLNVNVTGSFLCARAAFAQMRAQDPQGGRIINNGSISAHVPRPGMAPYTTSKHAITGLTRSLSLDGRPFNIACGQIDIGNAATEMTARMSGGVPQADGSLRPEPTMDSQHVADAVLHMASLPLEANVQFMTVMAGVPIRVCGCRSAGPETRAPMGFTRET
jgi:NAD(P)-dependent dehydrogenase (short-subunit alcohol dehydrogenase family)